MSMKTSKPQKNVELPTPFALARTYDPKLKKKEKFLDRMLQGLVKYLDQKQQRITSETPFKIVLFRNWIYTAYMNKVVFEYLVEGSGVLIDYFNSSKPSEKQMERYLKDLRKNRFHKHESWGLFQPAAIQKAYNEYPNDYMGVIFNLTFNITFKDNYLTPILASNYNNQFIPGTWTNEEAESLSFEMIKFFNEDFKLVFAFFEENFVFNEEIL